MAQEAQMTVRVVASDAQLQVNILAGDNVVWAWGDDKDFVVKLTSAVVAADAEPDASVYKGTSDHQGTAANSVVLSNVTANGDVQGLVNNGGNSLEWLLVDASAKTITLGHGGFNVYAATIIGGSATTSDLTLQTTSGVGATGADMHFLVGNNGATEAMTILNSSNVGIGTATPGSRLPAASERTFEVANATTTITIAITGGTDAIINMQDAGATSGQRVIDIINDNGRFQFRALNDESDLVNLQIMTFDLGSGNVGINTTVPQSLLDVQGAAGAAGILTLATKELTVVDNDKLGRIDFNAPLESDGGDAILVGASIWAEATATFSATVNTTDLVFAVGVSEAAAEKMRLDSAGTLWVSSEADSTTAARGIAFGLSKDTNLYRSAADTLKTDDNVSVGLKVTSYNAVATVGWGVPAVYGTGRSTAQTAAVASVATYTVGAADGTFIVTANVLVTTSTDYNFTVTVAYTDEGNTARTLTLAFALLNGTRVTAAINTQGAVPLSSEAITIRCKASTAITIATTGTFTTVTYNVEGHILQIA